MEDSKQETTENTNSTDELLQQRQSDATDDETLEEIEANRTNLDPAESNSGGTISPDGALDESDEVADAGPR